eukprot:3826571-Prymnesium_polylepis.1
MARGNSRWGVPSRTRVGKPRYHVPLPVSPCSCSLHADMSYVHTAYVVLSPVLVLYDRNEAQPRTSPQAQLHRGIHRVA